ncbi:MAG: hypothetical protein R2834_02900 [Rhodothermales bacterium]
MQNRSRSSIEYASYLAYSPRGESYLIERSRKAMSAVKFGKIEELRIVAQSIRKHIHEPPLSTFLHAGTVLVPVPRSTPLISDDTVWPAKLLCQALIENGVGSEMLLLLKRDYAVPKSSSFAKGRGDERPTVASHMETMSVLETLLFSDSITIVDDIVTRGSTLLACARLIKQVYPGAKVRTFALLRTVQEENMNSLIDIRDGLIWDNGKGHGVRRPS